MKPQAPTYLLLHVVLGLFALLSGCDKSTAGGSDEIDTRIAVDRAGRPVVGARIALVRAGDSTGKVVALSATGKDGSYPNFVVPDGVYALVLRDAGDSLGKYVDSLLVKSQKLPAGRDTLLALGSVRGVVRVSAGHSPATVTVGLLGTDILANVKSDGTFRIELVPGGLYTLGAFPLLEGYGPLYKRIQLKDGQNLTLPDTLVMPFTGLPSPGVLKALQDTGNGNVSVSWSRVDHPDLLGYVLERVEGGTVTISQFLTDTVWTDSLRSSWEAQSLFGPWPARNLAYRVRSRSLSGAPDSKSIAQTFKVVAPNWSTRMDSVRLVLSSDTTNGVTTLDWNTPLHPDVVGWRTLRTAVNTMSCQGDVSVGKWNDSACGDPRFPLASTSKDSGRESKLYRTQSPEVAFTVQAVRRNGSTQDVATASWTSRTSLRWVEWRDSAKGMPSTTEFRSFGGWLLWTEQGTNSKVSRDGSNWEEIPDHSDGIQWMVDGQGDSLWMARVADDSLHVVVASRTGPGKWVSRAYRTADTARWLAQAVAVGGCFAVQIGSGGQLYRTGSEDFLIAVPDVYIPNFGSAYGSIATLPVSGWMFVFSSMVGNAGATVYQGDLIRSRTHGVQWGSPGTSFRSPIGNEGGYLFDFGKTPAYFSPTSDGWLLTAPGGGDTWSPQTTTVFRDEIWAIIDGHLWKGKLNLPSSSRVEKP